MRINNLAKVLIGALLLTCILSIIYHIKPAVESNQVKRFDFFAVQASAQGNIDEVLSDIPQFQTKETQNTGSDKTNEQSREEIDITDITQLILLGTIEKTDTNKRVKLAIIEQAIKNDGKIEKVIKQAQLGERLLPDWELVGIEATHITWLNKNNDETYTQTLFN